MAMTTDFSNLESRSRTPTYKSGPCLEASNLETKFKHFICSCNIVPVIIIHFISWLKPGIIFTFYHLGMLSMVLEASERPRKSSI
jgi:hypothetical protein